MTQTSTRSLSKRLTENRRLKAFQLDRTYALGWLAFRQYGGETRFLSKCIRDFFALASIEQELILIDVGCGDAKLSCNLIKEQAFGNKLHSAYFLEQISVLSQIAVMNTSAILCPLSVRHSVFHQPFVDFNHQLLPNRIRKMILCVHASYYFNDEDLKILAALRNNGFGFLIIENEEDCWVSRLMERVGNSAHPQFDQNRFFKLLKALDIRYADVHYAVYEVALPMPSLYQIAMTGSFFSCLSGSKPIKLDRLALGLEDIISHKPRYSYRIIYAPST